jgi:hypothetical protein
MRTRVARHVRARERSVGFLRFHRCACAAAGFDRRGERARVVPLFLFRARARTGIFRWIRRRWTRRTVRTVHSTCSHKRAHYACMDGTTPAAGAWTYALSDGILLFRLIRIQGNVRRGSGSASTHCWPPFCMFAVSFVLQACKSLLDWRSGSGCEMDRIWACGVNTRIDCFQIM